MWDQLSFFIKHFREQLWIKPLIACLLSISAAFLDHLRVIVRITR